MFCLIAWFNDCAADIDLIWQYFDVRFSWTNLDHVKMYAAEKCPRNRSLLLQQLQQLPELLFSLLQMWEMHVNVKVWIRLLETILLGYHFELRSKFHIENCYMLIFQCKPAFFMHKLAWGDIDVQYSQVAFRYSGGSGSDRCQLSVLVTGGSYVQR